MIGNLLAGVYGELAPQGDYESIATVLVGSGGASSISFTSIPSTYQHLQIRWIARASSNGFNDSALRLRMNTDTSSTYWNHFLSGNGASASAGNQSNTGYINAGATSTVNALSNTFAAGVLDIFDYANTNKNKTIRHLDGFDFNGSGQLQFFSGSWSSTTAINALTLTSASSQFEQHSSFALYGIKG